MKFFRKNDKTNTVDIDRDALAQSFQIIDKNNKKDMNYDNYKLNFNDIRKRISIINPNFPVDELSSIFAYNRNEIHFNDLYKLLKENEIEGYYYFYC